MLEGLFHGWAVWSFLFISFPKHVWNPSILFSTVTTTYPGHCHLQSKLPLTATKLPPSNPVSTWATSPNSHQPPLPALQCLSIALKIKLKCVTMPYRSDLLNSLWPALWPHSLCISLSQLPEQPKLFATGSLCPCYYFTRHNFSLCLLSLWLTVICSKSLCYFFV